MPGLVVLNPVAITDAYGNGPSFIRDEASGVNKLITQAGFAQGTYSGQIEGRAADGSNPVGNPVYMAGSDGTNIQSILTDSFGRIVVASTGISAPTKGFIFGSLPTTLATLQKVEATAYTEPTSGAQRSLVSTSALDHYTSTGAQSVRITYFTDGYAGPYTETVNLLGLTAVDTVASDICLIEKMEVISVGTSGGTNQGTISLKSTTGGGGTTIGSIGINSVATVGDGRTLWTHHYIPSGIICSITSVSIGHSANTSQGSGGLFHLKSQQLDVINGFDAIITDYIHQYGQASSTPRVYGTPIQVSGPARITGYVQPDAALTVVYHMSFDFFEG